MQFKQEGFRRLGFVAIALALAVCQPVMAKEFTKYGLVIDRPHAMATAPAQPHGAVFFTSISNKNSQPDLLLGGRTTVSKSVEVHRMEMDNNVMKMREISGIELPANAKIMMARGSKEGYHLMLRNLKSPLKEGDSFPMILIFKNAGEVEVTVTVEKLSMPTHGGHRH